MASPGSIAASDDVASKPVEQITFRFCSECSNMLYPKEDPDNNRLQFTCRTCHYTEEASSTCVFRNVMNTSAGETAGVTQDVGSDPTVRDISGASTPDHIPYTCLGCGVVIRCTSCGEPADTTTFLCAGHGPETNDAVEHLEELDEDLEDFYPRGVCINTDRNRMTRIARSCVVRDCFNDLAVTDEKHILGFGVAITTAGEVVDLFSDHKPASRQTNRLMSPMDWSGWSDDTSTDESEDSQSS